MRYLIYGAIILFTLYMGRGYIKGLILTYYEKKNKEKNVRKVSKDLIYVPVVSSRTFEFAIEITEVGDGKATLAVVKVKG